MNKVIEMEIHCNSGEVQTCSPKIVLFCFEYWRLGIALALVRSPPINYEHIFNNLCSGCCFMVNSFCFTVLSDIKEPIQPAKKPKFQPLVTKVRITCYVSEFIWSWSRGFMHKNMQQCSYKTKKKNKKNIGESGEVVDHHTLMKEIAAAWTEEGKETDFYQTLLCLLMRSHGKPYHTVVIELT